MAKRETEKLDSIEKRDLLARRDADEGTLRAHAERYLAGDALDDALEFYDKLGDADGIGEVKRRAMERGNTYLLFRVSDSRTGDVEPEEWKQAGERAEALGKYAYAAQAFYQAGDRERTQALRRHLPEGALPADAEEETSEE